MGRKSKLTEEQWAELFRRVCDGESRRSLAHEYGLSEASIRQRESKVGRIPEVQRVARMIVETEAAITETRTAYESLPRIAQINTQSLAQRLISISGSLASAAELGAKTAHRLHALANAEVGKVDDAAPFDSLDALKGIGVLTKLANESSHIAVNLLSSNRETIRQIGNDDDTNASPIINLTLNTRSRND